MAQGRPQGRKRGIKAEVKAPLIIAAVLALVAFFGVLVFATGGTANHPEFRLALSAAGGVFVVTLVVCATLIIVEKPNDEELGEGTGVNRRAADLYAEARARKAERDRAAGSSAAAGASAASGAAGAPESATDQDATGPEAAQPGAADRGGRRGREDRPQFGQRANPREFN